MAGQKSRAGEIPGHTAHPTQHVSHGSADDGPVPQTSFGVLADEGMTLPLPSIRCLARFLAQCFQPRTQHAPAGASAMRDVWVRFPPSLLFGVMSALAGVLLLPDGNTVTFVALVAGVVLAAWALSLLRPLHRVWTLFLWLCTPLSSYLLTEILSGNIRFGPFLLYLSDVQSFLNLGWYGLLAVCLYAVTGHLRLSAGIGAVMGCAWGNLNAYLLRFRGRILFPSDIHALRTAAAVTSDYDWTPTRIQVLSLIWLLLFLLALRLVAPAPRKTDAHGARQDTGRTARHAMAHRLAPGRLRVRVSLALACAVGASLFFATPLVARLGIAPSQWFTQQNGVLLNFMINLKNSQVAKPAGYASARASMKTSVTPAGAPTEAARPNLIVVMNEAFSDLRVLGSIHTNEDPLPYLHALTKDTIKGNAYSSVIGGNTANSEYEFLTGNTLAFLPAGMVSYQVYTAPGDYSLTGQLNRYGYKTIAMHPYERAGWNREQVYRNFGFSEMHFIDAFKNKQYVRNYVSDRSNYHELIRRFDEFRAQDAETPLFFLNVTMQNHGGYRQTWDRLPHSVHVAEKGYTQASDTEGDNAEVNQYLSLTRESDNALKMLIDHFRRVEEPTIILLFGDHQPKLSDDFYRNVLGKEPKACDAEETQRMYTVPFALWANYDIPEAQGVRLSLNHLSSLLLETADLPLTPYQTFLSQMREVVPVINSMGMCGEDGVFVTDENALSQEGQDYVARYRSYQYNGIFDRKNRVESFFQAPDSLD